MKLKVRAVREDKPGTLSIFFEKPKDFLFYPAQFIDVAVDLPGDNSRIYSLSSSPTEENLMITFRKGISDHKKKLQTVIPGDEVTITHPNGTYTLDESSPAVLLAGGVGIAPHRSMIKWAVDQKFKIPLTLIYSNSDKNFVFKDELDNWQKAYPKLTIHYVISKNEGRLNQIKLKQILHQPPTTNHQPIYYLAGSPSFVEDMEKILVQLGVDRVNIRLDSFDGY